MENENQSTGSGVGRRAFLGGIVPLVAAGTSLNSWAAGALPPADTKEPGMFPGLITREKEPLNLEFPFPTLEKRITPNNRFFIRTHFPIPKIDAASWQLTIEGEVKISFTITYNELIKLPAKTVMATIECAGNGRAHLSPKPKGLLWEQGGIGNAEWTGVSLAVLLNKAGIKDSAIEVILEGADEGQITEEPKSPGTIKFARSLPVTKAMQPEVLIAYKMNGKDLFAEHGFPVRAIIPGWYGMASVKWLSKITATKRPYEGYWQTLEYAYWQRQNNLPTLTPVTKNLVKAEIARPTLREEVAAGQPYRIYGAAWGETEVATVEVSIDKGVTWQPAKLIDTAVPFAWRLWEYMWMSPKAAKYTLMARATDKQGNTQPLTHDPDRRNYMINLITPVDIEVV